MTFRHSGVAPTEVGLWGGKQPWGEMREFEMPVHEPSLARAMPLKSGVQPHRPLLASIAGSQRGFHGRGPGTAEFRAMARQSCPEVVGLFTCPREVFAFMTTWVQLPCHPPQLCLRPAPAWLREGP